LIWTNWREPKDSYSQHGEDILVSNILGKVNSFLEVGANDGVLFSNCYKFAKAGAHGLCLEPSSKSFWKLRLNHFPHRRVKCLNLAVSDSSRDMFLEEAGYESVLSNVKPEYCQGLQKIKATTMIDLWHRHPLFKDADLLSIDVEGHENEVLKGAGKEPLNAKVIILEADKTAEKDMLSLPCLRQHRVGFANEINLLLVHKKLNLKMIKELPEGFQNRI
tara:strand:+ start:5250 stop:5906 length:657 start_codon:yes stop_codon:yes gene_type:complete